MSNPVKAHSGRATLALWLARTVERQGMRVKFQLRGNNLHLLCESSVCPEQNLILERLVPALNQTDLNVLIPSDQPQLYQVLVYGRTTGETQPRWTAPIYLNQLDRHLEHLRRLRGVQPEVAIATMPGQTLRSQVLHSQTLRGQISSNSVAIDQQDESDGSSALILTNRSLAQRGDPDGIARYLSETLSTLGVAVQVTVKTIPYPQKSAPDRSQSSPAIGTIAPIRRLWITCKADYSPEPSLIGEPIAQKLRDLELEGFRDAVTLIQVWGEAKPDWVLRVDLTPTHEILRELARWGEPVAIARLLEQPLSDRGIRLDKTLVKESTLHLCLSKASRSTTARTAPDQETVVEIVAPLLEQLGPQGIHTALLYSQVEGQLGSPWVKRLKLPASQHLALSEPALTLAQQGDWGAIAFLLNRLLNPDLDKQLATGGIRLQLLSRQNLLHVMTDAPVCPQQRQVVLPVVRFLQQLNLPDIVGVRVYGRRAGQRRPLWSDAADFTGQLLVPEVTPEFAATEAYFGDLISRPSEMMLRSDLTSADLQTAWSRFRQHIKQGTQQLLIRSQLFVASSETQDLSSPVNPASYQGVGMLLVWGMAGLLLMVQADWMMGRLLHRMAIASSVETASAIVSGNDPTHSPFAEADPNPSEDSALASIPLDSQTSATDAATAFLSTRSPFPTFNSRQLDEKISLYYQRLAASGPPDVLIVGSSRALRGIDPVALQQSLDRLGYRHVTVFNFGINGATAQVVDLILRRILTPAQLPRLIVWADGARAFNSGGVDITYNGIVASEGYRQLSNGTLRLPSTAEAGTLPFSDPSGQNFGASITAGYQTIDHWLDRRLAGLSTSYRSRDRLKSLFQEDLTGLVSRPLPPDAAVTGASSSLQQGVIDLDGFLPLSLRFNPVTYYQQYTKVSGVYDGDYESFQIEGNQAVALRSMLELTRSRHIPVIFVNLPLTQEYLDQARLQHEQEFTQYMIQISLDQQGLVFRDLGRFWLTQTDYFSDPSHLNRYGASQISHRLAQDPMIPWVQAAVKKP
jgi:hypothetical protein